jgi:hypothetical protein
MERRKGFALRSGSVFTMLVAASLAGCDLTQEARESSNRNVAPEVGGGIDLLGDGIATVVEDTVPTCSMCGLEVQLRAVLGSAADPVLLRELPDLVVRDSRGFTYAAVQFALQQEIIVYAPDGSYVGVLGSIGEGPGEYLAVHGLALTGDSVVVLHDDIYVSTFTPERRHARTIRIQHRMHGPIVWIDSEMLAMGGWVPLPSLDTLPVHLFSPDGSLTNSLGTQNLANPPGPTERILGSGSGGTVWVAETNNYRLEELAPDGRTARVVGLRPPPSWGMRLVMTAAEAKAINEGPVLVVTDQVMARPERYVYQPAMRIASLQRLDPSTIAVAVNVAAIGWDTLTVSYGPDMTHAAETDEMKERKYRTAIDVVDHQLGQLLSRRFMNGWGFLVNDGSFVRPRYGSGDVIQIEVYDVRFNGTDGTEPGA